MSEVALVRCSPQDDALIDEWLAREHVARWWGPADAVRTMRRLRRDGGEAMVCVDGRAVGYLCWQRPALEELQEAGLDDLPQGLVDIDIMIGEPDMLGRGLGSEALGVLCVRLAREGVRHLGLAVAVANARAMGAYARAGFEPWHDFVEQGEVYRYFVRQLGGAGDAGQA